MKTRLIPLLAVFPALPVLAQRDVVSERVTVHDQAKQEYFLIRPAANEPPKSGYKLLVVLPGGDGSADFNPFVTNIAKRATGDDYLVAQLISVKWTPGQKIVWPTVKTKSPGMKFSTGEFIAAVISEIGKKDRLNKDHIYTLSWSSGGPAAYAASLSVDAIKGSFVAMSVFKPDFLTDSGKAKGHRFYIYHSPRDPVCPYRMAVQAKKLLSQKKAAVKLQSYDGGHGWRGDVFGDIRAGMTWLESREKRR